MAERPPETIKYQGNCHCGAVKFHVNLPELKSAETCLCSLCFKKGLLWVFPEPEQLIFERGESTMASYAFGAKTRIHNFCSNCGTQVLCREASSGRVVGLNVRTLMHVDVWSLKVNSVYNGKDSEPAYVVLPFDGPQPTVPSGDSDDIKTYTGSCHCGAVRIAVCTRPLPKCEVKQCNCSICIRNAATFIYPKIPQVSITGLENSRAYAFNRKFVSWMFCKTCGVATHGHVLGPPREIQARWSEEVRLKNTANFDMVPLNLRVLEGVEWEDLHVTVEDEIGNSPAYRVD